VYHPFPTSKSLWTQVHIPQNGSKSLYQYGIFGDTLIGGYTYHKVYDRGLSNCGDTSMTAANSYLMGGLMEDNFKRIYFYPFNTNSLGGTVNCGGINKNYKIYDFSKQTIGDTILFDTSSTSFCYRYKSLTINSIDSILIDNKYRKQYHLSQGETWIEGVGSLSGLFFILSQALTCSCIDALSCNLQNDTTYYYSKTYNYCFCYPLSDNKIEETKITEISPNPFSSQTILQIDNSLNNATLTVYNAIGQQVKQIKNISGQTITIQRDNLPNGLYFINLVQGNKIIASNKLVIID
jgi:hypothetical protein